MVNLVHWITIVNRDVGLFSQFYLCGFPHDNSQRVKKWAVARTRFTITSLTAHFTRIVVGDCRDGILFYDYHEVKAIIAFCLLVCMVHWLISFSPLSPFFFVRVAFALEVEIARTCLVLCNIYPDIYIFFLVGRIPKNCSNFTVIRIRD